MTRESKDIAVIGKRTVAWLDERFGIPNNYTAEGLTIDLGSPRGDVPALHLKILLTADDFATLAAAIALDTDTQQGTGP